MADQQTMNMNLFNDGLLKIFKEQWHPDVWLTAGDDDHEDPIPAHKAILAARSDILTEICDEEDDVGYGQNITLYEMNHEELEVVIEFMYVGHSMSSEILKKHARSYIVQPIYTTSLYYKKCVDTNFCRHLTRGMFDIL